MSTLTELAARAHANSRRWFPDVHETNRSAIVHFTLGLAGEAGEVTNLVKKWNRHSIGIDGLLDALPHELADVLLYALNLAHQLGIDLDRAVAEKTSICEARWG